MYFSRLNFNEFQRYFEYENQTRFENLDVFVQSCQILSHISIYYSIHTYELCKKVKEIISISEKETLISENNFNERNKLIHLMK